MSNIQDMNNRIKQNRDQRPSKRPKFKENNREGIYSSEKKSKKPVFKTVSETELIEIKNRIRERTKAEQRKERTIYLLFFIIAIIVIFSIPMLLI